MSDLLRAGEMLCNPRNDELTFGPLRPPQPLRDCAAHHPVFVGLRKEAQLFSEVRDALAVARPGVAVRDIGAPIAALRAVGVENPLDVLGDIAERIGLPRQTRRGRHLDAYVGVFRERNRGGNSFRERVVAHHGGGDSHVVENELQARVTLRDAADRRIAERYSGLQLILDHMGVTAAMVRDNPLAEGIATTVALAKYPNVSVKVSASPGLSRQPYPFRDVAEHIKRVLDAYGPQRSYWGTDITNSYARASYRQRITHFTEELSFLSEADKDWVMGRAISQRLRWT